MRRPEEAGQRRRTSESPRRTTSGAGLPDVSSVGGARRRKPRVAKMADGSGRAGKSGGGTAGKAGVSAEQVSAEAGLRGCRSGARTGCVCVCDAPPPGAGRRAGKVHSRWAAGSESRPLVQCSRPRCGGARDGAITASIDSGGRGDSEERKVGEPGMRMFMQPGSPRMQELGWGAGQSCPGLDFGAPGLG